jgi:hypothetical protein
LNRCRRCSHGRRPGLSDGYCVHRQDLPLAYGHLRELPADRGARCGSLLDSEGEGNSCPAFGLVNGY